MAEQLVGTVTHYFGKAQVAAVKMTGGLSVGDTIHIVGHTSDFTQKVESIQIDRTAVDSASAGDEVGIHVAEHAREHDQVFVVTAD